ncbi:MAG: sensor histidine kinase [Marinilabiliaceae bacterium]|nr:sensor histidine kinase [Marinilabiliaceae bacterium]
MKNKNFKILIFCITVCCISSIQKIDATNTYLDSLENVLKSNADSEAQFKAMSDLSMYYISFDEQKALSYAFLQEEKAIKEKKTKWLADAYENFGLIYFNIKVDSSYYYFTKAMNIWIKEENPERIAVTQLNLGALHRLKLQFDSALIYSQNALNYYEKQKNEEKISQLYANIAAIYVDMKLNEKHDEYALKALEIQERLGSGISMGITLGNLSITSDLQGNYDKAIEYGMRAIEVFRKTENQFYLCKALLIAASPATFLKDKRGLDWLNEALEIANDLDNSFLKSEALRVRARYYSSLEQWNLTKKDLTEALAYNDSTNKGDIVILYGLLLEASIQNNDKEDAFYYFKHFQKIYEELQDENWVDKLSEMEVKYETEKKELTIALMQEEKMFIIWLSISGGIILILLLSYVINRHRFAVNRRKLAENQIVQLEQEKQLIAIQAVLDGEISERTRLSRDLHDGLGGLLSIVKRNFDELKKEKNFENDTKFNQTSEVLDKSISEMRRISHNLMPFSLTKYGLKDALSDFCKTIKGAEFHYFGNEDRVDQKLELMIYHTVHELMNNAIKHANADRIILQIIREDDRIAVVVEDNGCGFDVSKESNGAGLNNIRNRVKSYNGNMDISSIPNEGTEISLDFKLINIVVNE